MLSTYYFEVLCKDEYENPTIVTTRTPLTPMNKACYKKIVTSSYRNFLVGAWASDICFRAGPCRFHTKVTPPTEVMKEKRTPNEDGL